MAYSDGIPLKKQFGQHFLRDQHVIDAMIEAVTITPATSIFEIGCGDGFLTQSILATKAARLEVFEIDPDWVQYVQSKLGSDPRLAVHHVNFLDIGPEIFVPHAPWIILANLPYQVTFPILHRFLGIRSMISEGVVMVQEEVAQKIVADHGRGYGFISLYFQHYFAWKLLNKIPPTAFLPPPKVFSRLLYFKPRAELPKIEQEQEFWEFIKICFKQPRRTLMNNLRSHRYDITKIPAEQLQLRAQQMNFDQLLSIWTILISKT